MIVSLADRWGKFPEEVEAAGTRNLKLVRIYSLAHPNREE